MISAVTAHPWKYWNRSRVEEQRPKYRITIRTNLTGYYVDTEKKLPAGGWYKTNTEYCFTYWGARLKAWNLNRSMLKPTRGTETIYQG